MLKKKKQAIVTLLKHKPVVDEMKKLSGHKKFKFEVTEFNCRGRPHLQNRHSRCFGNSYNKPNFCSEYFNIVVFSLSFWE